MKLNIGDKVGMLTVLDKNILNINGKNRIYLTCRCDCGNVKRIRQDSIGLSYRKTRSCGCYFRTINGDSSRTHGDSKSITYISWFEMKQRCLNKRNISYKIYGKRGIIICDEWKNSYECFLRDMGKRPSRKYTLDRIDPNGNYEKSNCRWATYKEQNNNRRNNHIITLGGVSHTVSQWAEILNINSSTILTRLRRHKSPEECLSILDNRRKNNNYGRK